MRAFTDLTIWRSDPAGVAPPPSRFGNAHAERTATHGAWRVRIDRDAASDMAGRLQAAAESGPWRVWMVGELLRYRQRDGASGECLAWFADDLARGNADPDALAGRYVIAARNGDDGEWRAWTDRLGSIHLYRATRHRVDVLSTCFRSAAALSSRRIDVPALASLVGCGFFLGDRTLYDDVRILPAATELRVDARGVPRAQARTWTWRHRPDPRRSAADTVEAFDTVLRPIVERMFVEGRTALPLSGGLDSRTIAGIAAPDRVPWAFSYGYDSGSIETRIADRIARVRGYPFTGISVDRYLFRDLDRVMASLEGFQDVTQARQACVADSLAARADFVLGAHWGDVWLDDMGTAGHTEPVADLILSKVLKRGRAWLFDHLVAPLAGEDPERLIRGEIETALPGFDGIEDVDFRVKAFKTWNWAFRWTNAGLRMYQAAAFPRLPFYDPRVVDFFTTVPTGYVAARALQVDWIKRYAPRLARIAWQPYGVNLHLYGGFDTWLVPFRVVRRIGRGLRDDTVLQRNWEVQFLGERGRREIYERLTGSDRPVHELVDPYTIRGMLDEFYAHPDAASGYTVSMLFSLAAWLESLE